MAGKDTAAILVAVFSQVLPTARQNGTQAETVRDGTGRDERNVHGRSKQANPFFFFFSQSPHLQRQVRPEIVRGSELGAILSTSSMARETAILTMMVKRVEKVKKRKEKKKKKR